MVSGEKGQREVCDRRVPRLDEDTASAEQHKGAARGVQNEA
jgi:hypothetical protein